ncbi:P-loop NTPase fold protein [Bradyrhizobium sp. CSA112]|uniref:P-loop NTPase fold protein n=1 Tax=Bradyrhizobium sp. CSA112 TaxID=2699170 RepID=UPI0023B0C174|nr:P-loop NTPase fold protein [Bradyrhizobium sp. CSA112]
MIWTAAFRKRRYQRWRPFAFSCSWKTRRLSLPADDSVIRHAVRRHFDGIVDEGLVTSYFDKLIQVPIRVPPLGTQEVRAYLMLLL